MDGGTDGWIKVGGMVSWLKWMDGCADKWMPVLTDGWMEGFMTVG